VTSFDEISGRVASPIFDGKTFTDLAWKLGVAIGLATVAVCTIVWGFPGGFLLGLSAGLVTPFAAGLAYLAVAEMIAIVWWTIAEIVKAVRPAEIVKAFRPRRTPPNDEGE
jgi:hypothetical protein